MFKNLHGDPDGPPCRFVEPMLQATASGRANFLSRCYALAHAARCTRCRRFLDSLTHLIDELRNARESTVDLDAIERLKNLVQTESR